MAVAILFSNNASDHTCLIVIPVLVLLYSSDYSVAMHLGSEIYQETLVKALAKHFGARLLVVDSLLLPGVSSSCVFIYW
jgi:uncharacterized membrane protein